MLESIITPRPVIHHCILLTTLLNNAKSIRKQEFPTLSHSFAAYAQAYYGFLNTMPSNWMTKYPEAFDRLEEDLETVRQYESALKMVPMHLRGRQTIN